MRSVHVGIGHDYDLVVGQFRDVDFLGIVVGADRYAQCTEHGRDFGIVEDFVIHRFLHVEDFTSQWQDGLELAVAALFGCSACGVTLDEEQFAVFSCAA